MKWDMNRPLTEVYSVAAGQNEVWQAEISHRYVLGVYELQGRITKTFPNLLLENCASGGGRFDPGMLYYSPQIWTSDNTDALVRMKVQYGSSLVYPARTIGAHLYGAQSYHGKLDSFSYQSLCSHVRYFWL
jgi:alpha-galactosidase